MLDSRTSSTEQTLGYSAIMDETAPRPGRSMFAWLVGASQLLGVASVVLTGVWMGHYRGGFAWDGSGREFNVHPLCMVLGLVFLQGDAILVYRVFRNETKRNVKVLHGIIHLLALIISIVGIVAVFDFHRASKTPDMYTLHSWCGMATLVLFFIQADLLSVCPRGGAGQHLGDPAGGFRGATGLPDHQGGVQASAEPRGRGSVCPLQDPDGGGVPHLAVTPAGRLTHPGRLDTNSVPQTDWLCTHTQHKWP
ncbi:transmembrane ascorbate-dependent reductase CYB561 isoform X3 [Sander vitreus]